MVAKGAPFARQVAAHVALDSHRCAVCPQHLCKGHAHHVRPIRRLQHADGLTRRQEPPPLAQHAVDGLNAYRRPAGHEETAIRLSILVDMRGLLQNSHAYVVSCLNSASPLLHIKQARNDKLHLPCANTSLQAIAVSKKLKHAAQPASRQIPAASAPLHACPHVLHITQHAGAEEHLGAPDLRTKRKHPKISSHR